MNKIQNLLIAGATGLALLSSCKDEAKVTEPAAFVDPFIGTDAHGHTYPGATLPFGMVQLNPNTRLGGWDGASGYHFSDSIIYGFAHTALNGTGVGDYGDILLMPVVGDISFINEDYKSPFKKSSEHAQAGYYSVFLDKPGVLAELTATTRVGYHKYTFPESKQANIIIDLEHRDKVTDSWIEIVSDTEICGLRRSTNWANDMVWYFSMKFSKPFARQGIAVDNKLQEGIAKAQGTNIKAFVGFETAKDEVIEVKVALSAVDVDGALKNLNAELPGWGFEDTRKKAFDTWNKELSRIIVKGGTDDQKKVYYTALYHTFVQPNTFNDVDGRYRGIDKNIHITDGFTNYTVFSLWDTYRAWHPLMTILDTARSNDFVKVMLNMYDKGGLLPIWELAANETYCMIGNHAISVIADAYMKGIRDYDADKALEAMIHSATQNHHGLDVYQKYGHIPGDMEHESISKTLEYAYNDWCIAQVAKAIGNDSIYNVFIQRAQYYKNIFDPSTGFMRPKLNGSWLNPFNPTFIDWHFTEANSWQYSFYVPQDVTGLYQLHGGKENMLHKLDELFETTAPVSGRDVKDITGLIGQYVHGNEPSHHAAYLFNFVNQPWKTQQWVRKIMDELYTSKPDGLCGNEDCGQMSAWLVISAMGFYPVAPGSSQYVIGTPWFPEMEINLQNGKVFKITADKVSPKNKYIQNLQLNGTDYPYSYISHENIMKGGHLHFVMGSQPNISWGSDDAHIPVTKIDETLILPVPVIIAAEKHIKDSLMVEIASVSKDAELFYTLDGSIPSRESLKYQSPISLTKTTTLNAVAFKEGVGYSFPVKSEFIKIDVNRKVDIKNPYSQSYHGGGPEALIDGIRGAKNWRLGGWQGYQGTDFEATIDLGKVQSISYVAAGFTQDIRSWIWMPKDVTFWISNDNSDFKQIAFIKNPIAADDYEMYIKDLSAKVKATGRYVRIKATNFGTIPQWHLGAGGQAYIFVDEVVIE